MNNNQQFDEHIKGQFNNYSPDVHPRIWENIIAKNEKRKPVGFWFTLYNNRSKLMMLGILITISTGGAWFYFNNKSISSDKQPGTGNENNNPYIHNNNLPGTENSLDQNSNAALSKEENTVKADTGPSLLTPAKTNIGVYSPSPESDDDSETKTTITKIRTKKTYTGFAGLLNINTEAPGLSDDDFPGQGTLLGRLTFNAQRISSKQKYKKQLLVSFGPISYLPDCPGFEKDAAGNKKYLEFYAGPDYAFINLKDTANSAYLQKRKESTKFSYAYSAGIRYTKVFNNSMSVRGGINYSQINEKFTFAQGNLIQITYIINAAGDTIGSYTTTGTRYKTTINKYRSIDVPVVIGYELGNGKLHANINAGVVVNIYSWQKGEVLDTAYQPVNITTGKNSSAYSFKTNAGLGFTGAVSVYYKLNDRIHIMAEPYFRYNLSPMNKENITLKQKYQTAGLRFGIRLDLK